MNIDTTVDIPAGYSGPMYVRVHTFTPDLMTSWTASSSALTVHPYTLPSIGSFSASRSDSVGVPNPTGTNASFSVSSSIASLNSQNKATYQVRTRETGGAWSAYTTLASTGLTYNATNKLLSGTFTATKTYEIMFTVTDLLGSQSVTAFVSAGSVLLHFKGDGTGLGIGIYSSTPNLLDLIYRQGFAARSNSIT